MESLDLGFNKKYNSNNILNAKIVGNFMPESPPLTFEGKILMVPSDLNPEDLEGWYHEEILDKPKNDENFQSKDKTKAIYPDNNIDYIMLFDKD